MLSSLRYKIFPTTFTGDQVRIGFTHDEERAAFERVVRDINDRIRLLETKRDTDIRDFRLNSTLDMEVAREYVQEIMNVCGLRVFNIMTKENIVLIPLPMQQSK